MPAIDYSELSKQIELGATLVKEAAAEFGSAATLAAQVEKLTADNAALTTQLDTAQNDLASSQAQVTDLTTKQTGTNDALAALLTPPAPQQ